LSYISNKRSFVNTSHQQVSHGNRGGRMTALASSRVVVRPAHQHQPDDFRRLPLSKLKPGQILKFPIHADDGMLLLADGSEITQRILDILQQRGYSTILVHRLEPSAGVALEPLGTLTVVPEAKPGAAIGIHNRATRQLDHELVGSVAAIKERVESPYIPDIPWLGTSPYSETLAREISQKHESSLTDLKGSVQGLLQASPSAQERIDGVVADYLKLLVEDIDLFASFASTPVPSHYPHRHSLHVAMLSLAMGVRAGLGEESLKNLGLGALLHDIGMLRIPRSIWASHLPISGAQQLTLMAHPIYSVEMVSNVESIPADAKYIAYQVHERVNGQGYPRRVPGDMIHPLAKIVNVADSYVALLSERPYRGGVQPYRAIESIIKGTRLGRHDAASVRLLLQTVSLYPVGSYVILSDGQLAKILRTNAVQYDRPVVRVWAPRTTPSDETGDVLDLTQTPDVKVVEAVLAPAVGA
jgi:HD-GYP domain-containing protein (c-di-GMP phosphodiesterase class II)